MRGRTIIGAAVVAVAGAAFGAGFAAAPSTHAATEATYVYRTPPSCLTALRLLDKVSAAEGEMMQSSIDAMRDYYAGEVETATDEVVAATSHTKAATEFLQRAAPFARQCRAGAA